MQPVVTPAEMGAIDAEAPEPVSELIERAGWATARSAIELIGPSLYGKRVLVLAGTGNNGADGRSAARFLERRGARCQILDITTGQLDGRPVGPRRLGPEFDLVIDACLGTGLRREFDSRALMVDFDGVPVLAVDIPSGADGLTGAARGVPIQATRTVSFAALKPGLLFEPARSLAGPVVVADIGLDCSRATIWLVEQADIAEQWPTRSADHHKWRSAVLVVGGSPGMTGAPTLCATAAFRAGAGYVVQAVPGTTEVGSGSGGDSRRLPSDPVEAVAVSTPLDWVDSAVERMDRFGAAVVGPGLVVTPAELDEYLDRVEISTVFDAGALEGFGTLLGRGRGPVIAEGGPMHVLTPHDGEFTQLFGAAPGEDRITAAREAASVIGAIVLLKGPTTVIANPDGRAIVSTAGDHRLATAGTGDVLSGVIAAGIAGGLDPFLAAAVGAELHGTAGLSGYRVGMTSGDLPYLVAAVLSE